jgi:radical SAM protein with 4Fe4S-binding SPASM domain
MSATEANSSKMLPRRLRSADDVAKHRPVHVIWELTLACNLRCVHCGSRAGRQRSHELSTEECLDVVRQLSELGTREVSLIGGEAFMRRDWLAIARAITDAGMYCSMQTGGRGFTRERIRAAVAAGVRTIGVSIDGPRELHDRLRGVKGSFDQAINVVRFAAAEGISVGVNTQINALSKDRLGEVLDTIAAHGAKFWQMQLTVAMGNAVDNADILLQPCDIPAVAATVTGLFERARTMGIRVFPGNNMGYFAEHEYIWRTLTGEPTHWSGCAAGETTLGLEADGTVKGCPALPADPFSGGTTRGGTIRNAIEALAPKVPRRVRTRGRGFCGSCYYWNVCRGGCTWVTHGISGMKRDNPYCNYRARELAKKGLRERVVKLADAPGRPFDFGRFKIVVEDEHGHRVSRRLAVDSNKRPRGRKLEICGNCHEFLFTTEQTCPHCRAPQRRQGAAIADVAPKLRALLDDIAEHDSAVRRLVDARRIENDISASSLEG